MKALPVYLQWLILLACSLALGFILQHYHVPAALLLGTMMVGLVMVLSGARIVISPKVFIGCQAILGCIAGRRGGDVRLVAFMQYLRVLFVATAAAAVAHIAMGEQGSSRWRCSGFRR